MPLEFKDTTGQPRSDEDIQDAIKALQKECVTNMLAMFKDGTPAVLHYTVIIDALRELLAIRARVNKIQEYIAKEAKW